MNVLNIAVWLVSLIPLVAEQAARRWDKYHADRRECISPVAVCLRSLHGSPDLQMRCKLPCSQPVHISAGDKKKTSKIGSGSSSSSSSSSSSIVVVV